MKILLDTNKVIKQLLRSVHIVDISEKEIYSALNAERSDFEDAIRYSVGKFHQIDPICKA